MTVGIGMGETVRVAETYEVGTSSFEVLKTASTNSTGSTMMTVSKCSRMST